MDNPLEMIYEYVEHAYLRQQVGDVIIRCLEQQDADPLHKMVEELILAGPQSVVILLEVIAETDAQKSQIQDRLHRLMVTLQGEWNSKEKEAPEFPDMLLYSWLPMDVCIDMLVKDGWDEELARQFYENTVRKNRRDMLDMMDQLRLLQEIGVYLQDWLWGLGYESYHQQYPYYYKRAGKHLL